MSVMPAVPSMASRLIPATSAASTWARLRIVTKCIAHRLRYFFLSPRQIAEELTSIARRSMAMERGDILAPGNGATMERLLPLVRKN